MVEDIANAWMNARLPIAAAQKVRAKFEKVVEKFEDGRTR